MATKDISDVQVCAAVYAYNVDGLPFADERLQVTTGQPMKVVYCALERAYDRRLIECGTSVRSAWLEDKGRALLESNGAKLLTPQEIRARQGDPAKLFRDWALNGRR